jgi:ATP-dependent DNA helicase DinG
MSTLNPDAIIKALLKGGAIANKLKNYENREAQLDLMRLIIRAFNEDKLAVAEAGTGVGKSFAYLLPALRYANLNDERIVISTATITLQQQLFEKDIPIVNSALEEPVKAVLIKGRGNYLCKRRLHDMLTEKESALPFTENDQMLGAIEGWSKSTRTGSRSELTFVPDESLWARVCSDSDSCMGPSCPECGSCFVMAVRRNAAAARILVVNHHLLFADLAARRQGAGYEATAVLPPYRRVVIDEAHRIEDSATSFFSSRFSSTGLFRQLGMLFRRRGAQPSGLLVRLIARLPSGETPKTNEWASDTRGIREAAEELNDSALELCGEESVFRLIPARDSIIASRLVPPLLKLRGLLTRFTEKAGALVESAEENLGESAKQDDVIWELRSALRHLHEVVSLIDAFMQYREHSEEVLWLERRHSQQNGVNDYAVFNSSPVNIAQQLKEALFEANKTVICVSATLTIANSFHYWAGRTGIALVRQAGGAAKGEKGEKGEKNLLCGLFPSPFPYESAVLSAVPTDAPLPNEKNYKSFAENAIVRLIEASGGSALVLFTSFESLRFAYRMAAGRLEAQGIRCLKQGDDDRSRLLRTFIEDEKSVLFATDSFWEGVDAPGATLRLVIMYRLPFKTPNDPVFEARCENLEMQGGSPFMDLSVPEAVMKFRQGFGRLIRRNTDSGAVVILDSRTLRKQYGRHFIASLPKTRQCFADMETIIQNVEAFLISRRTAL